MPQSTPDQLDCPKVTQLALQPSRLPDYRGRLEPGARPGPGCRFRDPPTDRGVEQTRSTAGGRKSRLQPESMGDRTVRFMILVKASKDSEAGVMPSEQMLTEMTTFN